MKFTKTSSTINQKDLSLNFNISEISTILKETSIQEWELFLTCNTEYVLLRILNYLHLIFLRRLLFAISKNALIIII